MVVSYYCWASSALCTVNFMHHASYPISEEIQREEQIEKIEKTQREEKQRNTKLLPRLLKPTLNPIAEMGKTEKMCDGKVVYVKVGEEEVQERLDQLRRCLVGWWGSGSAPIPGVESVRRWARLQWNIKNYFAVVSLGRGLWLFEFENKEEVDRVLMFGKRRFGTNLVHLRTWEEDLGCSNQGLVEEKAWVRVVGLPVHMWSRKIMEKIGDACGGFLAVDEETERLGELGWARILVKMKKPDLPNTLEVALGGGSYRMQLWWELSPNLTVSSPEIKRSPRSCRDDERNSRAGERVVGAEIEEADGDVGDKFPVSSSQSQRWSAGQCPGQISGRSPGKFLGQTPGRMTGQASDWNMRSRAGWAFSGPGVLRPNGMLGLHRQKLGLKYGPGSKAILKNKQEWPSVSAQFLSSPINAETEGRLQTDDDKHGEEAAGTNQPQVQTEYQIIEAPMVDQDVLNRFESSMPIDNSPSLSFFGRPLLQGGSSGLGESHVIEEEDEGVLPMEIVEANEMKGGNSQGDAVVEYGQEEGIVDATPLAVEGYEKWEDSMLIKFSEFLGFATEGFEKQIIELMRQMVKKQNKGSKMGQTPVSRCERELKKLECTINYGGQKNGKNANRDRGNFLLKLG